MKKPMVWWKWSILLSLIIVLLFVAFILAFNSKERDVGGTMPFVSEKNGLYSASGKYYLVLEVVSKDDIEHYRVVVKTLAGQEMRSDELFRTRDTFLALWDDDLDRVWAYSGDVGIYYWDIISDKLVISQYAEHRGENVPKALKEARPFLF